MRKQIAFATLTGAEIELIAESLDRETYAAVLTRVCKPRAEGGYGLDISRSTLERLWQKHVRLKKINDHITTGEKLTLAKLDDIEAAEIPASDEAHHAIMSATIKLAKSDDNTPHQLLALQRLADFPQRAAIREQCAEIRFERMRIQINREQRAQAKAARESEMHAHKIKMTELHHQLAERNTIVREKNHELAREKEASRAAAAKNSSLITHHSSLRPLPPGHYINEEGRESDNLGPIAQNLEEINARVRKQFGITPEESARRAELRKTWKDRNRPLNVPQHVEPATEHSRPNVLDFLKPIAAELQQQSTGGETTPNPSPTVAADVRRLTSASRDAIEEIPATLADQKPPTLDCGALGPALDQRSTNDRSTPAVEPVHAAPTPTSVNLANPVEESLSSRSKLETGNSKLPTPSVPSVPHSSVLSVSHPSASEPTHHSSPITHDLEERVDQYTIARMREHIAYQRQYESWPHRHSPPAYITQLHHCPCGNQCPCPVHESEEFGPFPERFWKIRPTYLDYAAILRERNLPFRFPQEFCA